MKDKIKVITTGIDAHTKTNAKEMFKTVTTD